MRHLKIFSSLFFYFILTSDLIAQSNIKTISLKKGEILDILLFTTKTDTEKAFEKYKKTAFPFAFKKTYQPLTSFKIVENAQGNIHPSSFIFSKWSNLKNREEFIEEIEGVVPDFHLQRRNIWTLFNLTYYEMPSDISFTINKDKYNVVTAYWKKENSSFKNFMTLWLQKLKLTGGTTILQLTNGKSTMGYHYNPDILLITHWNSKKDFEAFRKENLKMNHKGVLHVNQFILN
ncbi:hypothetical protein ABW636_05285 [Aquimarina sp. 2201CG1-2-11]|uniref:hypothetical protein n=1 Tax=Aquimarina discodermiae TaxID=3231043 RepID=UPI003462C56F